MIEKEPAPASNILSPARSSPPLPFEGRVGSRRRGEIGSLALAALSGLLLIGAFPHLDWGWLVWVGLVPLLATFPHKRLRQSVGTSVVFGVTFFGGLLYWLAIFAAHALGLGLGIVAWLVGTVAQTSVMVLFVLGAQGLSRSGNVWAWRLGIPALWTVGEWMRQLGPLGTGWGGLAYTQHGALPVLQMTKLTGVWGLAFLIVLVNVALLEVWRRRQITRFAWATVGLVCLALVGGLVVLRTERLQPTFVAAALQSNVNPNVASLDAPYVQRVMSTYSAQGREAAGRGAILTVWAEAVFPGYLRWNPVLRDEIAHDAIQNRQTILIGSNDRLPGQTADSNALFVMTPDGQFGRAYDKRQLVPWGEFVPFRRQLPFLEKLHLDVLDRQRGDTQQPLLDAGPPIGPIGSVICYESSYPRLTQEQVVRGARLLVIVTDDTWYEKTAAPRQHAAFAAVRAVECDRYLVRSAATGVSQVIDPNGRILAEAGLFRQAVVAAPVQSRTTRTPFVRWGDWFVGVCGFLLLGLIALSVRDRRRKTAHNSGR